jgi:hypothetical protein
VPDWSLADLVTALMAMRGIDLISAATFLAEPLAVLLAEATL